MANAYRGLLRIPGARGFVVAGFVGRMPMSMVGIGIVLLVSALTGSYATAGAISATSAVSYALGAPQTARLMDRFGQRRVLVPLVAVNAAGSGAFLCCAVLRAPLWTQYATAVLAGSTLPSMGSLVRARWSHLLADSPSLHTALSLESVADEVVFVTGPVLATLLATGVHPAAGLAASAALTFVGTLAFAAQRGTEPPVRPTRGTRSGTALATPGVPLILGVFLAMGAVFGTIDVTTVAFAQEQGHKAAAGWLLAVYALGSGTAGLWYGARSWRTPAERRFLVSLTGFAAGLAPLPFLPNLGTLLTVFFFSGLSISPTSIAAYAIVERRVPGHLRTEGMAWLSTAVGVGVGIGSPLAGRLVDTLGARSGYVFAFGAGLTAVLAAALGARRLRPGMSQIPVP